MNFKLILYILPVLLQVQLFKSSSATPITVTFEEKSTTPFFAIETTTPQSDLNDGLDKIYQTLLDELQKEEKEEKSTTVEQATTVASETTTVNGTAYLLNVFNSIFHPHKNDEKEEDNEVADKATFPPPPAWFTAKPIRLEDWNISWAPVTTPPPMDKAFWDKLFNKAKKDYDEMFGETTTLPSANATDYNFDLNTEITTLSSDTNDVTETTTVGDSFNNDVTDIVLTENEIRMKLTSSLRNETH